MAAVTTRCWYILHAYVHNRQRPSEISETAKRSVSVKSIYTTRVNLAAGPPGEKSTYRRIIFLSVPDARSIEVSARWSCTGNATTVWVSQTKSW